MDHLHSKASRERFDSYIDALVSVIGHADRVGPLHDYCPRLVLPGGSCCLASAKVSSQWQR